MLKVVNSNDNEWRSKSILKNKLIIDKIIYVSVDVDIIDYSFLDIYEIGLRNNIVDIRNTLCRD